MALRHALRWLGFRYPMAHSRAVGGRRRGEGVGEMYRTIAAASIVFAFAAFALHHSTLAGPLEEPLLLLFMGTLFLVVGKLFGAERKAVQEQHEAPVVERRL